MPVVEIRSLLRPLLVAFWTLLLTACGTVYESRDSAPDGHIDYRNIPDATPRVERQSRYGNMDSYVVRGKRYFTLDSSEDFRQRGIASWYGKKFHGRKTSSGEAYDMYRMTAAHKELPLPTYAQVTNIRNGRSVIVRINDRGPFHANRIIDLSYVAALKLGIVRTGTGLVEVVAIDPRRPPKGQAPVLVPAPRPDVVSATPGATTHGAPLEIPAKQAELIAEFPTVVRGPGPVPGATARLFLQVGAFAARGNAQQLIDKLQAIDLPGLRIAESSGRGTVLYRVQVGPFANVDSMDIAARGLAEVGYDQQHVIID